MKTWKRLVMLSVGCLLLFGTALPALAAPQEADLPPLPEWPIIGPIIRLIQRVIKKDAEPVVPEATVEPDLPEIPIETKDDILAHRDLESNERVRITATDTALVNIINDALPNDFKDRIVPGVTFNKGNAIITADVDPSVLDGVDIDVPISLDEDIYAEATLSFGAAACRATVTVDYVAVNNWSIGLKKMVQEWIDSELPGLWPDEVCVEYIVVEPGTISVVGYRK